jgi:hypothetical protein
MVLEVEVLGEIFEPNITEITAKNMLLVRRVDRIGEIRNAYILVRNP